MNTQSSAQKISDVSSFHVLIAAAGSGARFGEDIPKQYIKIAGKPILRHTIELFLKMPSCASVRVIIGADDAKLYEEATKDLNLHSPFIGGKERNISIYNGLKSFSNLKNEAIILIHDAARPCVHPQDIEKLVHEMKTTKAATLATPITSTLKRANTNGHIKDDIPRDDLWCIQTPQAFHYGEILNAHKNADPKTTYTDDTTLASALGINVKLVQGSPNNIKITYPEDLIMAETILSPQNITVSGMGFDVHAFDTNTPGPVRLCGIDVPHDHALKGHSDADVALHTLTDAIFGAIGEGDIGQHFPPSDNTFKNMNSAVFLEKALKSIRNKNGTLNNIDLTIICEAPKIGPHAQTMKNRLADLTGLKPSRINIKATTTEGLGFTGRGEGIAAQAIVSISLPDTE